MLICEIFRNIPMLHDACCLKYKLCLGFNARFGHPTLETGFECALKSLRESGGNRKLNNKHTFQHFGPK